MHGSKCAFETVKELLVLQVNLKSFRNKDILQFYTFGLEYCWRFSTKRCLSLSSKLKRIKTYSNKNIDSYFYCHVDYRMQNNIYKPFVSFFAVLYSQTEQLRIKILKSIRIWRQPCCFYFDGEITASHSSERNASLRANSRAAVLTKISIHSRCTFTGNTGYQTHFLRSFQLVLCRVTHLSLHLITPFTQK